MCVCVCVCVCFCVITDISGVVVHKYMSVDVVSHRCINVCSRACADATAVH